MRVGRVIARDLPGGQPGEPFRVILNANEGEGGLFRGQGRYVKFILSGGVAP